jgi:hypothetical protein
MCDIPGKDQKVDRGHLSFLRDAVVSLSTLECTESRECPREGPDRVFEEACTLPLRHT